MRRLAILLGVVVLAGCGSGTPPFRDVESGVTECGYRPDPAPGFKLVQFESTANNEIPDGQNVYGVISESEDQPLPETASEVFDTSSITGVSPEEIEEIWAQTRSIVSGEQPRGLVRSLTATTETCAVAVSVQHVERGLFSRSEAGRDWYVGILEQPTVVQAAGLPDRSTNGNGPTVQASDPLAGGSRPSGTGS